MDAWAIGDNSEAAEAQPPMALSGPEWSDQEELKSPPTIEMGAELAELLLLWRRVLSVIRSLRYWAGLSVIWLRCSHCCILSQSLLLGAWGSLPEVGGQGR